MADGGRFGPISFRLSLRLLLLAGMGVSWPMSATNAHFLWTSVTSRFSNSPQREPDVRLLELGKPLERELAGGQAHSYRLALTADQYVLVAVEQRGISVVIQLLGPDNKPIVELDAEGRDDGQQLVSQVAEGSGSYRLNVRANQEGAKAGRYEIRVVELRSATERDRVLQEARQLRAEGVRLSRAAKYDEALPLLERALAIREKTLGPDDLLVAHALNSAGNAYWRKGDYSKAEPLYQRALEITEKEQGAEHPDVATALNSVANLYHSKGDYVRAEPLYRRALSIREKAQGPNHPDIAAPLNNLANLYRETGDYDKAEPLLQRALVIREKALGPDYPTVAAPLNNLANLYWTKGDYGRAEPLYRRALAISEKALGSGHPSVALALNNLAILYRDKGDYAKAEPLYQRALAIREKSQGPEHPDLTAPLSNLGNLYRAQGQYAKAEPFFQRALAISESALGPKHPSVAMYLNNLADLYRDEGEFAKAEPLFQRALAIWENALGPEHANVAAALTNLGLIDSARGQYARAEPVLQRALDIREKALGAEHPRVAQSLTYRARLSEATGNLPQAVAFKSRACSISERNLARMVAGGSERQKLAYLAALDAESDQTVSLHAHAAPHNAEARSLAITTVLRRKGRALDAMADSVSALRGRAAPQDHALFDQLKEARAQVARLVLGGPQRTTPTEHQDQIRKLEGRIEQLEGEISRSSDEFRTQAQPVTTSAIQSAIPANAALIELYVYRPFNARSTNRNEQFGTPRYVAYILPSRGVVQWVDLGDAATIDRAVEAWRTALRDPNRADARRLARALDRQVMEPVRKLLGNTRHLLLSPDGALNLIPFGALVDGQNRYLIETYSFTYLTSGRDLVRLQTQTRSRQGPVVVANPLFNLSPSSMTSNPASSQEREARRSVDFIEDRFEALPSTGIEAQALGAVLSDAHLLTGADATEAAIKEVRGPRILHIATHGFFLADRRRDADSSLDESTPIFSEDPLLRAGLIMAGANQRRSGAGEDGILTASEVTALDLWGTRLVVLSACDTGLGDVKNGQGVYGLRRAVVLAGAQSLVMSLWQVADRPTRELMVDYYKGLQKGQGRSEALRHVQLKMLRTPERQHPYYWAAFIESGEWANLDGTR